MTNDIKVTADQSDPQVNDWQCGLERIDEVIQSANWNSMKYMDRAALLETQVKWDGFDVEQRFDLMENILQGKDRSRWLEGIETTEAKAARENAIWEDAKRRGNGSPNSEPYIRSEWLSYAEETVQDLKRVSDYVRLDDDKVVSERWEQPEGRCQRLGGWNQLSESNKLSAIMSSDATRMLGVDDTRSLLKRHIDLRLVPKDDQRLRMGEVLAPQAERLSDAIDSVSDEPIGIHQIWHQHGDGFRHVADVEGNYMAAVVLPMHERGHPAAAAVSWLVDDARATDLGDKIVDPLGKAYEIYSPDFGGLALRETTMPVGGDMTLAGSPEMESGRLPFPADLAAGDRPASHQEESLAKANQPARYDSPAESIALARETMREIKAALTRNADGSFPAKYAEIDWDGLNLSPPTVGWEDMDMEQRYDLLLHALNESIWSLEPSSKWTEPSDSQKLANEFVVDETRALYGEWRHDYGLRFLEDRGVRYEDQTDRGLDQAGNAMPDFRADVVAAQISRLEAFGDEFARLANTQEQKNLAEAFGDIVGEVQTSMVYIAEASRRHGPPGAADGDAAAERSPSPADLTETNGPASQKPGQQPRQGNRIGL